MPDTLDQVYFRPRSFKGLKPAKYLNYLLIRLERTFEMFAALESEFSDEPEFYSVIQRELHTEVSRLIRLQWVLGWDKAAKVTTPYKEVDSDDLLQFDLDHVIPVTEMAKAIIDVDDKQNRRAMFVRAWLAPVALISKESHLSLKNLTATSSLTEGTPFERYAQAGVRVTKCGIDLSSDFTISGHYDLLAMNSDIRRILREWGIVA